MAKHVLQLIFALLRQLKRRKPMCVQGFLVLRWVRPLQVARCLSTACEQAARALAARLHALGIRLIGITGDPNAAKTADFALDECFSSSERDKALAKTDVLVLCVRLAHQTRGLIDAAALAALPPGSFLVNAARGELVDYRAVYDALASGHLGGLGVDVFWTEPIPPDDPLLKFPNVIATPHVAGVTDRSYVDIAEAVATNIERFRRGEPPLHCVACSAGTARPGDRLTLALADAFLHICCIPSAV